jgi:aspartate racemase
VALFGTAYTMEQPFLVDRLAEHGLEVVVPEAGDRAELHRIVFEELVVGVLRDASRAFLLEVVDRQRARGVEGVILGCTEFELLVTADDLAVPLFPTTTLHARAAVAAALA